MKIDGFSPLGSERVLATDISIELVEVEGAVTLIQLATPVGVARMLAAVRLDRRTSYIEAAHVEGLEPGAIGRSGINAVLRKILVEADVDELVIQGATRTTGLYRGRVPSVVVSPTDVLVRIPEGLPTPVSFALLLKNNGLSLAEAHAAVTKLAADGSIELTLRPSSLRNLLDEIQHMGLTAYAVRNAGRLRVLMPAELVPSDVQAGQSEGTSALNALLSRKTVGDLRRIYGKDFARNYRSSAKLADVLYSMDPAELESIAGHQAERGETSAPRKVAQP